MEEKKQHSKRGRKVAYAVVGIVLGCIFLFPIYILVLNSFKNTKGIFTDVIGFPNAATFTMENYPNAFEALEYVRSFMNSLIITVIATALILLISAMAAWVLVRYKTKTSKVIFLLFAASMLIPFQCVMLPLVGFASRIGIMNPTGLVFMYMGFGTSMAIVMFHGFIKNIPAELEEAATIDGCGSFRLFFLIVVPLMKTILVTVAVLNVMWIWNDYLLPSLIINKPGWQTLPLKTYLFFGQFAKRWDLASSGLIMCIIPIIIFYLFCQKYIVKGITDGAIK
ncbi:MAG: carbohydrate ABC transporter permease [Ruminococcus sp.]|jgi:raffinose/stachyose/melibiose transport system permease protein|nr:carbohydrate ABC transporter permease [Ruminococcus sp.]